MTTVTIGNATLHHGDCVDVLPTLARVDAVVTDPPYGIEFKYASYADTFDNWQRLIRAVVPLCRERAKFVVMPAAGIHRLPWWYANIPPDWIVAWYKGSPGHTSKIGFNDWEAHVCWGKPDTQMHDYFATACGFDDNGHPCPKPIQYALWLVSRAARVGQVVVDPFMGSGTTGVACARLGRKFIGVEMERKYFDIACERIDAVYRQRTLFDFEDVDFDVSANGVNGHSAQVRGRRQTVLDM
jgi:site-specific DNA-methyltransferase (adenine-specific)/modification methylase